MLFLGTSFSYAKEEAEKKGDGGPATEAQNFVTFPVFLIPILQDRQVLTTYALELILEAPNASAANELHLYAPRLNDALLTDLYSVFGLVWSPDTRVFLKDLKTRLLNVAQRVVGKERVKSVLIQSFQEQKSNKKV